MSNLEKTTKRAVKKGMKKLHVLTLFLMVIALAGGFVLGAFVCQHVSKNDGFVLLGQKNTTLPLSSSAGATYLYTEEGIKAVCLGRDVSDTVSIKTELQRTPEGQYIIPLTEEGVYTITYTVEALKFGDRAPNGQIERVRVFIVQAEV